AAVREYRKFESVVPSAIMERRLARLSMMGASVQVVRPGVDFSKVKRDRNDALRESLGLAKEDYILLAAGETTDAAGHLDALWAASILHHLDVRFKLLLWGEGPGVARILRFA